MALLIRLEKRILVPLPTKEARELMVRHHLPPGPPNPLGVQAGGPRACEDINFEEISGRLEGYSGSDIHLVCKEAAMKPLRRIMSQIENIERKE